MSKPVITVGVRKYACTTPGCAGAGVYDSDIWPGTCECCAEFIWPSIPCDGCNQLMVTATERTEEVLYGWTPGIAQFGAGPWSEPRDGDPLGRIAPEGWR